MSKVIVIGGGAAGCFAAIAAAECGHDVTLLEKNEKLGKKIYITGKGRCNLTNDCDMEELFSKVIRNPKFLYSSFYCMDQHRVMDFFEQHGTPVKTERGNRVFPISDHASDVIAALERGLKEQGVTVRKNTVVKRILMKDGRIEGVALEDGTQILAEDVIVATGGCSYPSTGSTGDGYRFAEQTGHSVKKCLPALVPFETEEDYVKKLQGLSLRNVRAVIRDEKKVLYDEFGEMLFTHFGVSGPLMLSASSVVNDQIQKGSLSLTIDLKPALSAEQLDKRIVRDFSESPNRQFGNSLQGLYPMKLIPVMVELSGISSEKKVNAVTRNERQRLLQLTKAFPVTLTGLRGFGEAIITRGGVDVRQVDPSTMESKLVEGLFFAGEVLDVDALTGGFNLQIAWSTGYLAGISIR
ncbi:MAG: NAD(P)/FAD-dependent oxidoreductase [Roseburia sp.]